MLNAIEHACLSGIRTHWRARQVCLCRFLTIIHVPTRVQSGGTCMRPCVTHPAHETIAASLRAYVNRGTSHIQVVLDPMTLDDNEKFGRGIKKLRNSMTEA